MTMTLHVAQLEQSFEVVTCTLQLLQVEPLSCEMSVAGTRVTHQAPSVTPFSVLRLHT